MMLSRSLEGAADLLLLSFTRQYPKWLFPGENDIDPRALPFEEPHVRYIIDSINPLTWAKAVTALREHRPDAVILPWWTVYWAPMFIYVSRRLRLMGIPIYFFCHNVLDHDAGPWKRMITAVVLSAGDGFFVQSDEERARLQALIPGSRIVVHPHPVYNQFPKPTKVLPRRAAREFLFFGFVRPYKGLDILLQALAMMPDQNAMLTIAGEFWEKPYKTVKLIAELGIANRVEMISRYVSDVEAANLFQRADALVLPYRKATGSGVIGLAYHYRKPVIASNVPGLKEVVRDGETGILVEPESPQKLAIALSEMSSTRARTMSSATESAMSGFGWEHLGSVVLREVSPDRERTDLSKEGH